MVWPADDEESLMIRFDTGVTACDTVTDRRWDIFRLYATIRFPDDSRKSISHNCANHPRRLCESSAAKRGFQMIRARRLRESSGTVCARLRESSSGK